MSKWNLLWSPSHPRALGGIRTPGFAALLALVLATLLGGCAVPGFGTTSVTASTPPVASTAAPSATATMAPWPGAPSALPTGWVAYHAPHFAVAMPAMWQVQVVPVIKFTGRPPQVNYLFFPAAPSSAALRVAISEWDGLSPEVVRDQFCADLASQQSVQFAGLPMRYGPESFSRVWTFVSDQGTVYQLRTDDGPVGSGVGPENRAVLETFVPQYATYGC